MHSVLVKFSAHVVPIAYFFSFVKPTINQFATVLNRNFKRNNFHILE
jgi:hypothetical protein